jgi:predicted nucleic acid-binding protein
MYLVDTSIWIDFLREKDNQSVQFFLKILDEKQPFGITSFIYQEILQGASSQKDFDKLNDYMETQRFYHPKDPVLSYQMAAQYYFNCRSKGVTIRSTADCLIATVAIEYDLLLLHNDKDFIQLNKIVPLLKLAPLLNTN